MVLRFNDKIIAILLVLENALAWEEITGQHKYELGMFLKA